jgi:hypothetical protein
MDDLTRRFDRNKSKLETRAQRLGFVGTVTTKLYGVKIKAKPKRRDEYHLKREKPFQIAWERIEDERRRRLARPGGEVTVDKLQDLGHCIDDLLKDFSDLV